MTPPSALPTAFPGDARTVLVIAYHFPPGGGPGVQRVLKHVTYLHHGGWWPVVLTVENGDFPARDESLLALIPPHVPVVRVPIVEPYEIYRRFMGSKGAPVDVNVNKSAHERRGIKEHIAHVVRSTFFVPDARMAWWKPATRAALTAIKQYNVQAVYTSSPPYTCALIGRSVHRKTKLPWVAGFRDPWTGFLTTPERWWLPAMIDRALERSVFSEADAIECAWEGIATDALSKMPWLPRNKFHHIPNGFDRADFPNVTYKPNERFTITYTGSLYGRRTPHALLQALDLLLQQGTLSPATIELRFVGRFGAEVEKMLSASSFASSVVCVGYLPHSESIRHLMASEMSLLIVDDAKESADIVPGKVYEYLGVGRPILAIAPEGSAIERLIAETRSGFSVPGTQTEKLAQILLAAIQAWQRGTAIVDPDVSEVARYERRTSALQLAGLLDTLVTKR